MHLGGNLEGNLVNRSLTGSYHLISSRASRASLVSLRIGPTAPQPRQRARRPSPSESTNMGYRCSHPPLALLALRSETYPVRNAFIVTKDIIHRAHVIRLTHFGVFLKSCPWGSERLRSQPHASLGRAHP